jgi:uncharacterized protein (DUF2062 family)
MTSGNGEKDTARKREGTEEISGVMARRRSLKSRVRKTEKLTQGRLLSLSPSFRPRTHSLSRAITVGIVAATLVFVGHTEN